MSKPFQQLEEALNLPSMDDAIQPISQDEVLQALETAKNLEKEFEKINHYDQHDTEMDTLAEMAIKAHQDLQEFGMNVDVRHAGEIFSSSSQMLKIAVDAKNNKVEKKLKLMKLQLEKIRMDKENKEDEHLMGTAMPLDRNEILKIVKQINSDDK
jgi:predicted Zn-dependent protease